MTTRRISQLKYLWGLGVLLLLLAGCAGTATPPVSTAIPTAQVSCPTPLDAETLSRLEISARRNFGLQPGQSTQLQVGVTECCVFFDPKPACVVWSITSDPHVRIDAASGQVSVDSSAVHDSAFVVTANVENGKQVLTTTLHVYVPSANPLVGNWHEDVEFACGSGKEVKPAEEILELIFTADRSFSVTWHPFEVYRDYAGKYEFDLASGRLDLTIEGGNYVPTDFDGSGTFKVDDQGRLVFTDIWFGQPSSTKVTAACGHRFVH
jgi:hypothetical protein